MCNILVPAYLEVVNGAQLPKQLQMLPMLEDVYHVTGILKLPYAEIEEPFEAWFNKTGGKSRIQYYDGQVITYQLSYVKPFGANFKVTPETTETEVNIKECFQINGTSENPITPQSVFPNIKEFQPVQHEHYNGQNCTVLQSVSYWGKKKNTYKLWMTDGSRGPLPVHYEMKGFNTLLGSHYDKYEIDYTSYSQSFSPSIFNFPPGIKCAQWPRVGPEHRILANPMQEFVGRTGEASQHHEQQILIDCSWGFGNRACDGGQEPQAFEWIMKHGGIATAEAYGPYMGQNGYCHYNQSELMAPITGFIAITSQNMTDLKAALYKHGPIAVNIDASHKSFAFYSNGIYYEPNCGNTTMELDHAVLAVGYGDLQGEPYWLIKNSWSTYWGNDGYILMSMKENNCGVTSSATYPILA
ncbi:Digestive cysteine proteinase 2, partial [Ophiophagus hannah]